MFVDETLSLSLSPGVFLSMSLSFLLQFDFSTHQIVLNRYIKQYIVRNQIALVICRTKLLSTHTRTHAHTSVCTHVSIWKCRNCHQLTVQYSVQRTVPLTMSEREFGLCVTKAKNYLHILIAINLDNGFSLHSNQTHTHTRTHVVQKKSAHTHCIGHWAAARLGRARSVFWSRGWRVVASKKKENLKQPYLLQWWWDSFESACHMTDHIYRIKREHRRPGAALSLEMKRICVLNRSISVNFVTGTFLHIRTRAKHIERRSMEMENYETCKRRCMKPNGMFGVPPIHYAACVYELIFCFFFFIYHRQCLSFSVLIFMCAVWKKAHKQIYIDFNTPRHTTMTGKQHFLPWVSENSKQTCVHTWEQ